MIHVQHDSSVLAATDYSPANNRLHVIFTSGETYLYSDVPFVVYQALLAADSKGAFFNANIPNIYPFQHLPPPNPSLPKTK